MCEPGHRCTVNSAPDWAPDNQAFLLTCECGFTDVSRDVLWRGIGPAWKANLNSRNPDHRIKTHHGFQYIPRTYVDEIRGEQAESKVKAHG